MYGYPITPPKSRLRSKTHWVNLLVIVLMGAETQLNLLQPLLPVNVFALVAFLLPLVNMVLRELTARGVRPVRLGGGRQWPPAAREKPWHSYTPGTGPRPGAARPEDEEGRF
jgi:hypothetical protein